MEANVSCTVPTYVNIHTLHRGVSPKAISWERILLIIVLYRTQPEMYYDYSNIDNVIISSVFITIMKTLKLGGKRLFFLFFYVLKDLILLVLTTEILSWVLVACKCDSFIYCMRKRNVKRTQKAFGQNSDCDDTCRWILIILLLGRRLLLVFLLQSVEH